MSEPPTERPGPSPMVWKRLWRNVDPGETKRIAAIEDHLRSVAVVLAAHRRDLDELTDRLSRLECDAT